MMSLAASKMYTSIKLGVGYQKEQLSERIFSILKNASLEGVTYITREKFHTHFSVEVNEVRLHLV